MQKLSKTLAFALRHHPETFGLTLNSAGWVPLASVASAFTAAGIPTTVPQILEVVATDSKTRFMVEGSLIRANQGHTTTVNLGLQAQTPPAVLFHGTVTAALSSIRTSGLMPMKRHAVHLSPNTATATQVASRRGIPVILTIKAAEMHAAGHVFTQSANGVWLVSSVPTEFIQFP